MAWFRLMCMISRGGRKGSNSSSLSCMNAWCEVPPCGLMCPWQPRADSSYISPFMVIRLKDPSLLHSAGLIGGKWVGARNNATYDVSNQGRGGRISSLRFEGPVSGTM